MDADNDGFGLGATDREAVVRTFPNHVDVYSFAVAEVHVPVPLIKKNSRHANPEPSPALRIGLSASEGQTAAFVFADRGREEGHFRYAFSREACEANRLEMTRPQATVGHDPSSFVRPSFLTGS
jgi:hypothetical protein